MHTIYSISCTNGRCYVGSTKDRRRRWRQHRTALRQGVHDNEHLQRTYNKLGSDAFSFNVLDIVNAERAAASEYEWMLRLDARESGFNMRWPSEHGVLCNARTFLQDKVVVEVFAQVAQGAPWSRLAKDYDCHVYTIRRLIQRKTYADVPVPDYLVKAARHKSLTGRVGEANGRSKLTRKDVVAIKERLGSGETATSISKDYPVTRAIISRICRRVAWAHV